jgi:hypothetical protein
MKKIFIGLLLIMAFAGGVSSADEPKSDMPAAQARFISW